MKHSALTLSIVAVLVLAACTPSTDGDQASSASTSVSQDEVDIVVESHEAGDLVASPLTVTGKAHGGWYFEASFPVRLLDGNGNEIAVAPAQAQGDWMTPAYVPFSVTLTFTPPSTSTGTLVLENDNPSGLPENAKSISLPVTF